jgi:uncharacterized membrane protein (UPF0127 family)
MIVLCSSCVSAGPWVELKGQRFEVEIADTPQLKAQGLMFRDALQPDYGMLFIFQDESPRAFWMRNTRIPLDILYFDSQMTLVSAAENVRPCRVERCPSYPSQGPARYVLEINAGLASQMGVQKGDRLTLHLD